MFESTLPAGEPELMRVSAFRRYLDDLTSDAGGDERASRLSSLSPSLMQDLLRFEQDGRQTELLEAVAACLRHGRSLCIHVQCEDKVVPLTLFPHERLVHCPWPIPEFLTCSLEHLQVLHVESAVMRPPGDSITGLVGEPHLYHPLGPVTWQFALRGRREDLLPEIAGIAAYRVAPGFELADVPVPQPLRHALRRLRRQTTNLREIASWPGLDRVLAMRLLNGLYLQAGLIVTRTHPAATDTWFRSVTM